MGFLPMSNGNLNQALSRESYFLLPFQVIKQNLKAAVLYILKMGKS